MAQVAVARETYRMEEVAKMLDISLWQAYKLARKDELPVPVIRYGARVVVSKRALDELLGAKKSDGLA